MLTGFDNPDLDTVSNLRKTSVINKKLTQLKVDIAAFHETRPTDAGSM